MSKRNSDHVKLAARRLERDGIAIIEIRHRGKHRELIIERNGKRASAFIAVSPSDR
jgi:hypothetical protein